MQIVLVSGTRHHSLALEVAIKTALEQYGDDVLLIHGAAAGADTLADRYARSRRWTVWSLPYIGCCGKRGGILRNSGMGGAAVWTKQRCAEINEPCTLHGHAFPASDSRGTWDGVAVMQRAGIKPEITKV